MRPPFLPGCKLILRRRLVQRILVISQWRPSLLQQSICEADDPLSVKTTYAPEPSLTMSNSAFLRWQMSISVAKWTFFLSLRASRITSFLARNFVQLPGWNRFELLPFLFHCCFRSLKISWLKGMRINLWVSELNPLSAMWSSWFSRKNKFQTFSKRFMSFHNSSILCFLARVSILTCYSFP